MVGSNGTMIAIRLVRSKLRKREDHGTDQAHAEQAVVQTATPVSAIVAGQTVLTTNGDIRNNGIVNHGAIITASEFDSGIIEGSTFVETNADQYIWRFPPPYPPLTTPYPPLTPPPQYTLYNDQDTLVHGLQADRPGFAKGIKKNIGCQWRRLLKRKSNDDTFSIPPELKGQLKTIYVY